MDESYTPDTWIVVKITTDNTVVHKVLAGWSGSYLYGHSWKINSGIKSVTYSDGVYSFLGFSGSTYRCRANSYGFRTAIAMGYSVLEKACKESGAILDVLDEDTDWLNYKYING